YRVNGLPTRSRGINDSGRVAGWLTDAPGSSKGFVINAPSGGGYVNVAVAAADYIGVAGATFTFAEGINNAGYVSGSADMAVGGSVGYVAAPPAVAQIADLSTQIGGFGLPFGTENALQAKLRAAQAAIAAGDISGACGSLQALINQANAQAGKKLTRAQADAIIAAANAIRASLSCV
ncbi:MAG TPA: hypothetical protein VFV17_05855, partial [Usitatibacteraceae bacterium]|nr:hypothetical protein [Usitatibacteraceae bacterium]